MPREKLLREKSNDLVAAIRFAPPGVIHGPQPVTSAEKGLLMHCTLSLSVLHAVLTSEGEFMWACSYY